MNALIVHLHLRSSLLITQLGGGDPNSGIGYNYVPGSTLRGALISRYLDGRTVDAADPTFRRLFLDGGVRYLNGYPLTQSGMRMLPTPLSWQQPKDAQKGDPAHDWALGRPLDGAPKAWKGVGGRSFCHVAASGKVEQLTPEMKINIHIAREDRQRPTSGSATIFRYDALAEGQTFAAVLVAEDATDLARLRELLPDKSMLAMGRSRTAGYGWVEVRYPRQGGQIVTESATAWTETLPQTAAHTEGDRLVVTLLSDALIQDPQTGAQCADLVSIVGVAAQESYTRLHTVGGFNRKWNLPMPQAEAIAAGSVFVYPYTPALAQQLNELVAPGIGSRRAEGFGRIAVDWQRQATIEFAALPKARAERAPTVVQSRPQAEQMVQRMLRATLDRKLLQAINDNKIVRRGLRNSQLARIRVVAQRALAAEVMRVATANGKIEPLSDFLGGLKDSARNQLQRARLGDQPFNEWLLQLAKEPTTVWTTLQMVEPNKLAIGDVQAQLTMALAIEYTLRLIDGMTQVATREENDE